MSAARKKTIRLGVILSVTILLAAALTYTSFDASTDARTPADLLAGTAGEQKVQLTGVIVPGSLTQHGTQLRFKVVNRGSSAGRPVPVVYRGSVPDPIHARRKNIEVLLSGRYRDGVFHGQRDSLTAKCPSKYQAAKRGQTS